MKQPLPETGDGASPTKRRPSLARMLREAKKLGVDLVYGGATFKTGENIVPAPDDLDQELEEFRRVHPWSNGM